MGGKSSRDAPRHSLTVKLRGVGKALPLFDGVRGGSGLDCYFTWPGIYQDEWNNIVAWVELFRHLDPDQALFSTSCIFLPEGDTNYGKHAANTFDRNGFCWCQKLYGGPKEWGCRWFELWQERLGDAIARGQHLVAVYKREQSGMGDETPWSDLPVGFSSSAPGLGGSQRGEVAFAKELLGGARFRKVDIDEAAEKMQAEMQRQFGRLLRDGGGISRFNAAVRHCPAAQFGLRRLTLNGVRIAAEELQAFSEALQSLKSLRHLSLQANRLGDVGARALAKALPALASLQSLDLAENEIGDGGAGALAQVVPALTDLKVLDLFLNPIGDSGREALMEAKHQKQTPFALNC